MPLPRGQQVLEEEPTVCARCELTFKSFSDYHLHKMRSRRHITCDVCSQDFESHEAAKQHHDLVKPPSILTLLPADAFQMHSHVQDMDCPGCGKHFTRLGGLMSHIELTECAFFKKDVFEKNRKMKQEWYSNQQNVRNFLDYGRTAGDFGNNSPNPFLIAPGKLVRGPDGIMLVTAEDQAAKDKVAREQESAAREQAAREQVAREQAAREEATREQAAQFHAALVQGMLLPLLPANFSISNISATPQYHSEQATPPITREQATLRTMRRAE